MRATCRLSSRARSRCSRCRCSSGDSAESAAEKGACVAHAAAHLSSQLSASGDGCDGASAAAGVAAPLCRREAEAEALLGRCWAAAPSRGAGRCQRLAFDGWTRGVVWVEAWWGGRLADDGLDHMLAAAELSEAGLGLRLLALAELGRFFWKGVGCGAGDGARR